MTALDSMLKSLRDLADPRRVGEETAKRAAVTMQRALTATLAAGTTPEGHAWKPKKDGGRPYEHAAQHITTAATGTLVVTTLRGPDVFGHKGTNRIPRRQMLPDAGAAIPASVERALTEAARQVFDEAVKQ